MADKPQKNMVKVSLKGIVPKLKLDKKAQFIEAVTLEGKKILFDKSKEITNPEEILKIMKYSDWFSNALAINYVRDLQNRYSSAKSEEEKNALLAESANVATVYSVLVYAMYEKSPKFKMEIDGNKEYKANFTHIQNWLNEHRGKEAAESFVSYARGVE